MADDPRRSVETRLLSALIFLAVLTAFLPVLDNGFVDWDDHLQLIDNPYFRGFAWPHVRWMLTSFLQASYQPLTWLTLAADFQLWRLEPAGYHATSLLFHAANGVLVFMAFRALLARWRAADSAAVSGCAAAALLWAVHPLRVEAVAWASERREVVGELFWLGSLLLYLRAADRSRLRGLWPSMACFIGAVLAKGTMLTLPLVLVVVDLLDEAPIAGWRWLARSVQEKWPFFMVAAAAAVVGCWAIVQQAEVGASLSRFGLADRLCQAALNLALYPAKTAWPSGLRYLYPMPIRARPWRWPFRESLLFACCATALAWRLRRRRPGLAAAWAAEFFILAPVFGAVKFGAHAAADRYSNLATLPWFALGAWSLTDVFCLPRLRVPAATAAAAAAVALGVLSRAQSRTWRDSESLWRRALACDPGLARAEANLGVALLKRGDQRGRLLLERAAAGGYAPALDDLGGLAVGAGDAAGAERSYRRAVALEPWRYESWAHLGAALAAQGRLDEALAIDRHALALKPDFAFARYNAAQLLTRRGRLAEAEQDYRRALSDDPTLAEARNNLGLLLAERGAFIEATRQFQLALAGPVAVKASAHFNWALVLARVGDQRGARRHRRESRRLATAWSR